MSNIIPPLLSSSPPPMVGMLDEEEDDEFGDFAAATNLSYGCDALSLPSSPQKSPNKTVNQSSPNQCHDTISEITDINAAKSVEKDFQDKRKASVTDSFGSERIASASESSLAQENQADTNVNNLLYNNSKMKPKADNKYNTFQYFPEIPPDIGPDDDEFGDVDNDYAEDFDEFQGFENGAAADNKLVTPDEAHIRDTSCTMDANPEPSLKLTEQALNDSKPCGENPELEDTSRKCDESLKINDESTEVERNSLEMTKSQVTDCPINAEVSVVSSSVISNCNKDPEETESSLANLANTDLQESTCNENSVADSLSTQPYQTSVGNENVSSKNKIISESENVETQDDLPPIEEPPVEQTPSEDEDDFGDFENPSFKSNVQDTTEFSQPVNQDQVSELPPEKPAAQELDKPNSIDDDFGDFETSISEPKLQWDSDPFNNTKSADLDINNFGDFDNQVFEEPPQVDKDPDDFGTFSDAQVVSAPKLKTDDEDDFGDFNDYSVQAQTSQSSDLGETTEDARQLHRVSSVDIEAIPQQAQTIILDMFPVIKQSAEDYQEQDFTSADSIFRELKDVTDTCALLYQWSKSNSQKCLLRALSIDTRNIFLHDRSFLFTYCIRCQDSKLHLLVARPNKKLYGPRWNESMPRYAATLGFTPLEPVKSEILTPTSSEPSTAVVALPSSQTPSSEPVQQTDIPSAQFDWVGSGLTNPLEMTPKKVIQKRDPQLKESKNYEQNILHTDVLVKTPQEIDIIPVDSEFSSVLQPEVSPALQTHSDSGSVKSLQLNEIQPEEVINKIENSTPEFNDFTSFQSSSKSEESPNFTSWSFNAVPLRETHISNSQSDISFAKPERIAPSFDEPGWLKPTILTPDLPRKIKTVEDPREEESEFANFQTSETNTENVPAKSDAEIIDYERKSDHSVTKANLVVDNENDDEFTDFQSTLPNSFNPPVQQTSVQATLVQPTLVQPTPVPQEPLQPAILEPLKPSILQPMVPASINWPDPGITDDDLIRIELNYKPKSLNSDSEAPLEVDSKQKTESSSVSGANQVVEEPGKAVDDDDWSDFVSSQGPPAPVTICSAHPAFKMTSQVKQPSRTSTPELSLSVPQLNQIQPPRRPVPVITQQGLFQTKLPVEPLVQPSVQQTKTYPQVNQLQNGFQPSLISNQFAAQFGQGLGYRNVHQNKPPQNIDVPKQTKVVNNLQQDFYNGSKTSQYLSSQMAKPPAPPLSSSKADEFDDEWTDFVSSQPAPPAAPSTLSNGLHGNSQPKINFDWNRPPQFTSWSTNVTPNIITNPVSFDSFQSYTPPAQTDLLKNRTSNRKNPNVVVQPKKSAIPSISSVPDLEFIAPKSRTWKK